MVTYRRAECLGHPVVLKFLNQKLNSNSVRFWIVDNMLLYMIFLVSLTTYTGLQSTGKEDHPVKYSGTTPGINNDQFLKKIIRDCKCSCCVDTRACTGRKRSYVVVLFGAKEHKKKNSFNTKGQAFCILRFVN
jgi:hypothetical protein